MLQRVLPFKLETTKEKITPHAGLAIFGEFIHATGIIRQLNRELPSPGSNRGYRPAIFVEPLLLMLNGGGRSLEDLRKIKTDSGLRELLHIGIMPSSDATGNWLRRMGNSDGLAGLQRVNNTIIRRSIKRDSHSQFTLDIDATQIVAEKYTANFTYKGEKGYMPIVGHLAENGLVVGDDFREGNVSPSTRNLEFIQYCCQQMPKRNQITALRADSATYQARIFNWCEKNNIQFAIGGQLDSATKKVIANIEDSDWKPYGDKQIAETVHSMEKTEKAFRLIAIKHPQQQPLPIENNAEHAQLIPVRYSVIATNRHETSADIIAWYNKRGDTSENRIKELKIGFGMERMPCGTFAANSIFFRLGVLAYNLFVLFKMTTLPQSMQRFQIQTIRWQLFQIAGKIVNHAGSIYLKINQSAHHLLSEIRARSYEEMIML